MIRNGTIKFSDQIENYVGGGGIGFCNERGIRSILLAMRKMAVINGNMKIPFSHGISKQTLEKPYKVDIYAPS